MCPGFGIGVGGGGELFLFREMRLVWSFGVLLLEELAVLVFCEFL